jgi:hypothetical protein
MQVPALVFERTRQHVQAAFGKLAGWRQRLHRGDMHLEHLQVVQATERILRLFQLAYERQRRPQPRFAGDLQAVAQLLGGNPDAMEALGVV